MKVGQKVTIYSPEDFVRVVVEIEKIDGNEVAGRIIGMADDSDEGKENIGKIVKFNPNIFKSKINTNNF